MFSYVRAAAFAVAALGAALAPSFADPTLAWELEPTAAAPFNHAAANLDGGALEVNMLEAAETLPNKIDPSAAVTAHAVATLTPEDSEDKNNFEEKAAPTRSLSALVEEHSATKTADSEMECLAGAIYFESKGEPLAGQLAVAEVIINRAKSGRYPSSLCGVVKQRGQFSFIRGGRFPAFSRDNRDWRKAVAIAHIAIKDLADSPAAQALSFHATRVSPGWRMKRVARVGNHIFYR